MRPHDTSPEAHELQIGGYRRMGADQKATLVAQLSEAVRELAREGIRQRHPDYGDDDVRKALVTLLYGRETSVLLWPDEDPRRP